jgi:hypothetical protein
MQIWKHFLENVAAIASLVAMPYVVLGVVFGLLLLWRRWRRRKTSA